MKTGTIRSCTATAAIALMLASAGAASAQTAPPAAQDAAPNAFGDIVVTATRRETNVQDVPLAITAIGGTALRDAGITSPRELTGRAPNLTVDQGYSNGQTHVSIRGIASTDFSLGSLSPVGIYIDDVYQAFQYGIGTQIYDLNRLEVLRGPQGTLFGKNTTGGALAYYSQTPRLKATEGYVQVNGTVGDYSLGGIEGAVNVPLGDTLALRFSGRAEKRDDYIDNLFDGSKLGDYASVNGRVQLRWEPSSDTKVNLKLFGLNSDGDGPVYFGRYNGNQCNTEGAYDIYNKCVNGVAAPESPSVRTTYSEVPSLEKFHTYGATLRVDQGFGDWGLTSITSWQKNGTRLRTNDDGTGGDQFHSHQVSDTEQFTQEARLATPDDGPLKAIVGGFFGWDRLRADQVSGSTTLDPALGFEYIGGGKVKLDTTSLAAFGSATYDVTDTFSLVGGVRYSYEKKKITGTVVQLLGFNAQTFATRDFTEADLSVPAAIAKFGVDPAFGDLFETLDARDSWKRVTWDATANWKPTGDLLFYGKVSTGFRSGGYPTFITQPGTFTRLNPEKVTSYEAGFKAELFDRTVRINGSGYYVRYSDMQVQTPNTNGPGLVVTNAASAEVKGLEVEIQLRPSRQLSLYGTLGYNDASYKDYAVSLRVPNSTGGTTVIIQDYSGNALPFAPKWSGGFGGNYTIPAGADHSVELGTSWTFRSSIFMDPYANKNGAYDRSFLSGDVNLSYGTSGRGWRGTLFVQNLTDRTIRAFQFQLAYTSPTIYAPKRLFGARLNFDF